MSNIHVKITYDSGKPYYALITDTETGEMIQNITAIEIKLNAKSTQAGVELSTPTATMHAILTGRLDIVADATISTTCACCGQKVPARKTAREIEGNVNE